VVQITNIKHLTEAFARAWSLEEFEKNACIVQHTNIKNLKAAFARA